MKRIIVLFLCIILFSGCILNFEKELPKKEKMEKEKSLDKKILEEANQTILVSSRNKEASKNRGEIKISDKEEVEKLIKPMKCGENTFVFYTGEDDIIWDDEFRVLHEGRTIYSLRKYLIWHNFKLSCIDGKINLYEDTGIVSTGISNLFRTQINKNNITTERCIKEYDFAYIAPFDYKDCIYYDEVTNECEYYDDNDQYKQYIYKQTSSIYQVNGKKINKVLGNNLTPECRLIEDEYYSLTNEKKFQINEKIKELLKKRFIYTFPTGEKLLLPLVPKDSYSIIDLNSNGINDYEEIEIAKKSNGIIQYKKRILNVESNGKSETQLNK